MSNFPNIHSVHIHKNPFEKKFSYSLLYSCVSFLSIDTITGEFGLVYQSYLTSWQGRTTAEVVAVKTLKSKKKMYILLEI